MVISWVETSLPRQRQMTEAESTTALLVAARVLVLVLGIAITFLSYRAYRRTRRRYMRDAAIGFAVITIGVFIEGFLFEVVGLNLEIVHITESVAIAIGLVILLFSLYR